jgi:hypothetical protein
MGPETRARAHHSKPPQSHREEQLTVQVCEWVSVVCESITSHVGKQGCGGSGFKLAPLNRARSGGVRR